MAIIRSSPTYERHEPFSVEWMQTRPSGDPGIEARYIASSPLVTYWPTEPSELEWPDLLKCAGFYIAGMAGFAIALAFRVARFVGRLVILIGVAAKAPLTGDWGHVRDRSIIVGITLVKIFSALIGILCPLAAYKIDRALHEKMPISDQSAFLIYYNSDIPKLEEAFHIFELPDTATKEEVKKSYKELALKYHPDKNSEDKEAFNRLTNAKKKLDFHFENQLQT